MKRIMLLITIVILTMSCSNKESDLSMDFTMTYDNQPLVILENYNYPDGRTIRFTRVSFFISELVIANGIEEVLLSEVNMINLTSSHMDLTGAEEGVSIEYEKLDIENINEVRFNLGLSAAQNSKIPADYPIDNPLSNSAEYWPGWSSYVFAKIEGFIDTDNDGTAESTFAMHLGSDQIKRNIVVSNNSDQDDIDLEFKIDLKKIFEGDQVYDIIGTPNIHSPAQLEEANFLINNWKKQLENPLQD